MFVETITDPRVVASYRLSVRTAFVAACVNALFGALVAWVLVRYEFPGKRVVDALIDLPFALPTAVAGITLTALYAPNGWLGAPLDRYGIQVAFTPLGITIALIFIGLPFVIRTLQPVIEDLDEKKRLFASLEGVVGEQAIFASNTSTLSITALAEATKRPTRVIGLHFFNPAPVMKLVEIVPTLKTDPEVLKAAQEFTAKVKKTGVTIRDFTGFVVNDWNAHGQLPGCSNDNCPAAINAGIDMYMAPSDWKGLYSNLLKQVKDGTVPMSRLDDAVHRILRVKVKAGLLRGERPLEAKYELLGSPEHRAVAREAVRKSLVLLKNDGALPIRANARILVAGDGADNIGKQCGGWTLSWQGTGNANSDFPKGQSIYAAIAEAAKAGGGSATLSPDGSFTEKPDVAVVVFGEEPYAEFQGDLATMHYKPGDDRDVNLLRSLKSKGIPVVAVFISGRPLWMNREINAANAFVAAWLPGTEGGGVGCELDGVDAEGKRLAERDVAGAHGHGAERP